MGLNLGIIASSRSSAPSAALLLDTYPGAAAAYSLRKLRTAYTGAAIRVRRSSDNTETDIGFNGGGGLDTTALTTFIGANNGFVTKWYDQSGNTRDATQSTTTSQPKIVSSGVINLQGTKPAILFDGSTNSLFFSPALSVSAMSNFSIFRNTKGGPVGRIWSLAASTGNDYGNTNSATLYIGSTYVECIRNNNVVQSTIAIATYCCITTIFDGTNKKIKGNAASFTSNASTGNFGATIGCIGYNAGTSGAISPQDRFGGNMLEQIYYYSDQTSNNTGINLNINTYYSIY